MESKLRKRGYTKVNEASEASRFLSAQLDPSQERMFNEVVMIASNEGRFYEKKDAKGAVDYAIKEYIKNENTTMREDASIVRKHAEKELTRQWGRK